MESFFRFLAPPSPCGYLPDQLWSLEYDLFVDISPLEYRQRMEQGWRRFGTMLFHPHCPHCVACQTLRVLVDRFQPDRSQRRAYKANADQVRVTIGTPSVSREKLLLYDRYHAFQADHKGWPEHPAKDAGSYCESFVNNPFPTQEWCYFLKNRLIGVGYVDDLPEAMSAIYFFYEPELRHRSLGTYNILCILAEAAVRRIPYLYLGYYVKNCGSMEYKARFTPNQILGPDRRWIEFRH